MLQLTSKRILITCVLSKDKDFIFQPLQSNLIKCNSRNRNYDHYRRFKLSLIHELTNCLGCEIYVIKYF